MKKIQQPDYTALVDGPDTTIHRRDGTFLEKKCPICKGAGHIKIGPAFWDSRMCDACNGTGKVRRIFKTVQEALDAMEEDRAKVKQKGIDDVKPMKHDTLIMDDVEEDL